MKEIGRTRFLGIVSVALLAVIFLGYVIFPIRTEKKPEYISFISPKDILNVASVTISREGDPFVINLERGSREWNLVIDKSHKVPVRKSRIEGFFKAFSEKHKIVSIGKTDIKKFGIQGPDSFTIQLYDKAGSIITTIDFGYNDESGTCRYFMIRNRHELLRMDTTIDEFLDVKASAWAELAIFAQCQAQYNIQQITVYADKKRQVFHAGKDKEVLRFETELDQLECLDVTNITAQEIETIEIEYGNLKTTSISLAQLGENWILSDSDTSGSYIITDTMMNNLNHALGIAASKNDK